MPGCVFRTDRRINIPTVSIRFIQVTIQTRGKSITSQRPTKAEIGATRSALIATFRLIGV